MLLDDREFMLLFILQTQFIQFIPHPRFIPYPPFILIPSLTLLKYFLTDFFLSKGTQCAQKLLCKSVAIYTSIFISSKL